jgi:hypothetical protein
MPSGATPTPTAHCRNRDDIFAMFRQRQNAGIRIAFDEMRSTPNQVLLTARVNGSALVVTGSVDLLPSVERPALDPDHIDPQPGVLTALRMSWAAHLAPARHSPQVGARASTSRARLGRR